MSNTITIRFNKNEMKILCKFAKLYNCSVSLLAKRLVFEKLDEEIDILYIREYEKLKNEGMLETFPISKLWGDVSLDN